MGDMDSGNSGSMQSSSTGGGGDEQEYESRGGESFPSFFNPPNYNPFENARLLQLYSLSNGSSSSANMLDHHHQHQQQQGQVSGGCNFDSLETGNLIAQNNHSNNSNLEMVWANKFGSASIRSAASDDATCTTAAPGYPNASNPMSTPLGPALPLQGTTGPPDNSPRSSNQNQSANLGGASGGGGGPGRNPKKRSRASRRAPTTVLTTDTSNFRQMVQEFTGIPAPPFSASGFSSRTRLDLFGGMGMGMGMGLGAGMGMGMGILPRTGAGAGGTSSTSLDPPPPSYLLRPFAQKILPHPSPTPPLHPQQQTNTGTNTTTSTSALAEATSSAGNTSNNMMTSSTSGAANGATTPAANTFHLSPQNVLQASPNPMFAFQSLLQPSPSNSSAPDKYPLPLIQQDSGVDNLGPKGAGSSSLGRDESEPQGWAGLHQGLGLTQGDHDHHHHQQLPPHQTSGSVNPGGGGNFSGGTDASNSERGAPMNGTSDNHGGVVRGERGMVDSWICSSD